jgi:phosphatidylglycerol:prolipoprotein diacylglycerol transferase
MVSPHSQAGRGFIRRVLQLHNHAILARVGPVVIATYGPFMALAFFVGFACASWYDLATGQDAATKIRYYAFVLIPMVLLGARLASMMLDFRKLLRSPVQAIVSPGYMLQGGILGGFLALWLYAWMSQTSLLAALDTAAFAVTVGEALGRVGCHVYGCCWGSRTDSLFAIRYINMHAKVLRFAPELYNIKIHPAPLYASFALLGLFAIFVMTALHLPYSGMLAAIYLMVHPLLRLTLERFRADDRGRLFGRFTHTNLYSLIMFVGGVWAFCGATLAQQKLGADLADLRFASPIELILTPLLTPWLVGTSVVGFLAFGVHVGKLGQWIAPKCE